MNERRKLLLETIKQFNKDKKDSLLDFASNKEEKELVPFGIPQVDEFLGGGSVAGTFTVIYGGESVGKSTLTLQKIANCQKEGKICCLIDLEHSFDRERAIQLGVNLEELVLAEKCQTAEDAMNIIRVLCMEKVVDVIVVDSVQAMSPISEQENKGKIRELEEKEIAELARKLSKFFRVVAPDVFRAKADIIMIGQVRIAGIGSFYTHATMTGGEGLKHWAYMRMFLRRGQGADAPVQKYKEYFLDPDGGLHFATRKNRVGFDCVIKLEKTKSSDSKQEGSEIHLPFYYDTGFVAPIIDDESLPIKIEGTDEEKIKVEELLKEKGILLPPKPEPIEPETIEAHIQEESKDPKVKQEIKKETKKLEKNLSKKRGRGRPKGSTKKEKK